MVSKGAPTTAKKEPWKECKRLRNKKKKYVASNSDKDTSEEGEVHCTGIAAIVSARSWASVASSDDDDEILPSLGSTSLAKREC